MGERTFCCATSDSTRRAPGFALILSWLAQKWQRRCQKLAPRKNCKQHLTNDSAAAELIHEITHGAPAVGPMNPPTPRLLLNGNELRGELDLDAKGEYGLRRWRRQICHNGGEDRLCDARLTYFEARLAYSDQGRMTSEQQ
jgi:hypothetical protein